MINHNTGANQMNNNHGNGPFGYNNADFFINIDLPNVEIIDVERDDNGVYTITLQNMVVGTDCTKCGNHTNKFKKWGKERILRDLPIFNCPVFIKFTPPIYKCERCGKHNTQRIEWSKVMSRNTLRFEEYVLRQLINSTVQDVAKKGLFRNLFPKLHLCPQKTFFCLSFRGLIHLWSAKREMYQPSE